MLMLIMVHISDPNIFSMTQRITLAQTQLQVAQSYPQLHDLREARRKLIFALNIKDIDAVLHMKKNKYIW